MRSLTLAQDIAQKHNVDIRFAISEKAPYFHDCPFPVFSLPGSPTKHTKEVNACLSEFHPDVAIFDASGRAAQLQHCKKLKIKTVFICQHYKKLKKGLSWRRLLNTDAIWSVQPDFAMPPLTWVEHLKLSIAGGDKIKKIGPIFAMPQAADEQTELEALGLEKGQFVLFNAGSGGHQYQGQFVADIFADAAKKIAAQFNIKTVMIYGPNYPLSVDSSEGVLCLEKTTQKTFLSLLNNCQSCVISGGSGLLQAIALGVPNVAVAVSSDQPERINSCEKQGLTRASEVCVESMLQQYAQLSFETQSPCHTAVGKNGIDKAVGELEAMLEI